MVCSYWIELEGTLGISFQLQIKSLLYFFPALSLQEKYFVLRIEPLHHLREFKAAEWVVTSSIQSSLRASLALLKKGELETDRKKSIFRRAGKVFFFFSLQLAVSKCYPTTSQSPRAVPHTPQCHHTLLLLPLCSPSITHYQHRNTRVHTSIHKDCTHLTH